MSTLADEPAPVEVPVMEPPPVVEKLVRGTDRCDACGAAEAYVVTRHSAGDLCWCNHCYRKFPNLVEFVILDESDRLHAKLTSS
jgi:hypothetical protein